jgi:pyroglutamyl-peptidase
MIRSAPMKQGARVKTAAHRGLRKLAECVSFGASRSQSGALCSLLHGGFTAEFGLSATFLVTGFEPFADHRTNTSWDALALLRPNWPEHIVTRCLPVDYRAAHALLRRALLELEPRVVLCMGIARGEVFRIERCARRPAALAEEPGETKSQGRWPWHEMRTALEASGVVSIDSEDAGQYVCESTYWSLLNYGYADHAAAPPASRRPDFAGFLHVPPAAPALPLETIARAVDHVVRARSAALSSGLT